MTWSFDGRAFAKKVKNPSYGVRGHIGQARSIIECPSCGLKFNQSNTQAWPGLPIGVKFDPSDQELLAHLAAKVEQDTVKAHPFIDEFIPTVDEEDGICYTHPEKLPGVRHDGSSTHFFHRPAKAYTTGTRKRRKVQMGEETGSGLEMRWHKTGKTRPVVENGKQIGCKKIMVLYVSLSKKAKADKTNWVMHQYHLGVQEEEKEGEFVVSKIFYQTQPRQCGLVRKEDGDDSEHVVTEMVEQQAYSYHHSSPSTLSNSNNTHGAPPPPPKSARPLQGQAVKQHKGLLATIAEDVERLQASLSGHSHNTVQSSDQSNMAVGYDSTTLSCKSGCKIQGSANYSAQCSPELGEKDTCCSEERTHPDPYGGAEVDVIRAPIVQSRCDGTIGASEIAETLNAEVLNFLSSENLDITLRLQRNSDVTNLDKGANEECVGKDGGDMGANQECDGKDGDKVANKADFSSSLENIILDTPPDFLLESFLNSQESTDWFGKKKFWSDSSQKTDDGTFLDFIRDSQSSV